MGLRAYLKQSRDLGIAGDFIEKYWQAMAMIRPDLTHFAPTPEELAGGRTGRAHATKKLLDLHAIAVERVGRTHPRTAGLLARCDPNVSRGVLTEMFGALLAEHGIGPDEVLPAMWDCAARGANSKTFGQILEFQQAARPRPQDRTLDLDEVLGDLAGERFPAVNEVLNWAAKMTVKDAAAVGVALLDLAEDGNGWITPETAFAHEHRNAPSAYTPEAQQALQALIDAMHNLSNPQHKLALQALPQLIRTYAQRAGVVSESGASQVARHLAVWAAAIALADRLSPQHVAVLTGPWHRIQQRTA